MKSSTRSSITAFAITLLALSSKAFGELPAESLKSWRATSGGSCMSLDLSDTGANGEGQMTVCTFGIGGDSEDGCSVFNGNGDVQQSGDWFSIGNDDNCGYINMEDEEIFVADSSCGTVPSSGFSASEGGICTSGAFQTFITFGTFGLLSALFLSVAKAGSVSQ